MFGYFLHLGPLHRLHLPHPWSMEFQHLPISLALVLSLTLCSEALLFHTETIVFCFFRIYPFRTFYPFFLSFFLSFFLESIA